VVGSIVGPQVVMRLEGLEEFLKHLLFRFLFRDNIRVECAGVHALEIIIIEIAIAILVHDLKSRLNVDLSVVVHRATDHTEKLVVLNQTVRIGIKKAEESGNLALGKTDGEVRHGFSELVFVKRH